MGEIGKLLVRAIFGDRDARKLLSEKLSAINAGKGPRTHKKPVSRASGKKKALRWDWKDTASR